jgi:hypothetical protein
MNGTIVKYKGKAIRKTPGCARNAYFYKLVVGGQLFSTLEEAKAFINQLQNKVAA